METLRRLLTRRTIPGWIFAILPWVYKALDAWGNFEFGRSKMPGVLSFLMTNLGLLLITSVGFLLVYLAVRRDSTYTEVYQLRFADIREVGAQILALYGRSPGMDLRTHTLSFRGTAKEQAEVRELVTTVDVRPPVATPVESHEPRVEIRIPNQPNRAAEDWLEWIHVEAEAFERDGVDAVMSARIGEQTYSLRWATDEGPRESRTLHVGRKAYVPLVLRYHSDTLIGTHVAGTNIKTDTCYVTDEQFLIHRNATATLANNHRYRIEVTVTYGGGHMTSASFWLNVPLPGAGMLELSNDRLI
jgi:hypothetical protein